MTEGAPSHRMTYGGYLRLDELLELQDGPEGYSPAPCNDEQHFVITHQAFELWFKMILRELKEAHALLNVGRVEEKSLPSLVHHLDRVTEIFRLLSNQWKVMETLSPQDFLAFRDKLGTSSGFESWQMRELEVLLGLANEQRMGGMDPLEHMRKLAQEGKITQKVLSNFEATSQAPSLNDALMSWLERTPINGSLQGSDG
ncbi:tryptophan 2,3-dioxygenase family protein, partial [Candidatus Poseidoniales archaeon]|nr:tryptophan 2,3-dioxygenase family protein [Candidatus Poseidoniales archaeon]